MAANPFQGFHAVNARHHDIEEDEVERLFLDQLDGGQSGLRLSDKKAAPFEAPDGGDLNFCMNVGQPGANLGGGWEVDVQVDELGFN